MVVSSFLYMCSFLVRFVIAFLVFMFFFMIFFLMIRRPPRSTRTDTPFPTRRSSDLADLHRPSADDDPALRQDLPHAGRSRAGDRRSEEHTSELQSLLRISYAVFCLKKKKQKIIKIYITKLISKIPTQLQKHNHLTKNTVTINKEIIKSKKRLH